MSTLHRYELPIGNTGWTMGAQSETSFTWEYDDESSKLLALYENGKRKQWNASDRIDWSLELDPENPQQLDDRGIFVDDGQRNRLRFENAGIGGGQGQHRDRLAALQALLRRRGPRIDGDPPSLDPGLQATARKLRQQTRQNLIEPQPEGVRRCRQQDRFVSRRASVIICILCFSACSHDL